MDQIIQKTVCIFHILFFNHILELLHSYSFTFSKNSKIFDSVVGDGFEGLLIGGTYVSNEKVIFPPRAIGGGSSYIELPASVMEPYKLISIELWATLPLISNSSELMTIFYYGSSSSSVRCSHSQVQGDIICSVCTNPSTCSSMTSMTSYSLTSIHMVVQLDSISGSMTLFVNSILQCSSYFSSSLPNPTASNFKFLIGAAPTNVNELSFVGSMDEFRVWAGAIPSSTLASHYTNGPTFKNIGKSSFFFL